MKEQESINDIGFQGNVQVATNRRIMEPYIGTIEAKYDFYTHFHPYVGQLLSKLSKDSVRGLLDVNFHQKLGDWDPDFFNGTYSTNDKYVGEHPKLEIDVSEKGPYSIYNWELFFHAPLTIAVHLSKNQRFAEAQRWFHYIFDPTCTDTEVEVPKRFWKFLAFRDGDPEEMVEDMLIALSSTDDTGRRSEIEGKIDNWRNNPFQPHAIARTRFISYQYYVVMKYLDNLIAWGDSLFRQDSIETINEATQLYVLAANVLGNKPQELPQKGKTKPKTFAQIKNKFDAFGNALVDLEAQFPFNLSLPSVEKVDTERSNSLFGIGASLYFCIPKNDKLLGYWDLVADRLFKIRHCMNIEGIVRQLPLFQPPIDPGMLVKAAAGGIDISNLISGLNQPLSPIRSTLLIQKALEICNEVRSLGNALLSALEKQEGEALSLLRQKHEINILELTKDVRFLQWKEAESATEGLVRSRETAFQRYQHYQILLGKKEEDLADLKDLVLERQQLTEENFDEIYTELVGKYGGEIDLMDLPPKEQAGDNNPSNQSGATGEGILNLNKNENLELNIHMPASMDKQEAATLIDTIFGSLGMLPNLGVDFKFWGIGGHLEFGGPALAAVGRILAGRQRAEANKKTHQGTQATKTAGYERRAEDWILQNNLAAKELMQIGKQIISSLIREQITQKEYDNHEEQIKNAQEVDTFLKDKFTNEALYTWMQGELSKIFYDCYKFAFDIAKKAEQTMKHELMRPEFDKTSFIKFNYWDGGRKGLLSGDSLYLDLKRMEMAYHDHNKREYELTKHISLRQLDPMALLALKATGVCEVSIPEWVYDLDTPGHYMRRIKTVALSIPAVTGPYTSVNCTLSLQKSTVRKLSTLKDGAYAKESSEDERFIDYFGTIQSIVTSSAQNDSGLFEANLREERFLPFEGAGVESTWRLELPVEFRQFDYNTISDVILHIRFTARQGGGLLKTSATTHIQSLIEEANTSGLNRLFSLKHDFPNEWHQYITNGSDFKATFKKEQFNYLTQGKTMGSIKAQLISIKDGALTTSIVEGINENELNNGTTALTIPGIDKAAEVFLIFNYTIE